MSWETVHWDIPIHLKPVVLLAGLGIHGNRPVEYYRLEELWCIHLYQYYGELRLNGVSFPIEPGSISVIPPGISLEHHFKGRSVHSFAHFKFATSDLYETIKPPILAMQRVDDDLAYFQTAFTQSIGYYSLNPARTEIKIWDILWELIERNLKFNNASPALNPAVQKALHIIELKLGEPLSVSDLAQEIGLSHNHLTRLFRSNLGSTVINYIQERRIQRAKYLLTYTNLPVKAIAAETGIRDLQLFNKTVRRKLGASPRNIRNNSRREPAGQAELGNS